WLPGAIDRCSVVPCLCSHNRKSCLSITLLFGNASCIYKDIIYHRCEGMWKLPVFCRDRSRSAVLVRIALLAQKYKDSYNSIEVNRFSQKIVAGSGTQVKRTKRHGTHGDQERQSGIALPPGTVRPGRAWLLGLPNRQRPAG